VLHKQKAAPKGGFADFAGPQAGGTLPEAEGAIRSGQSERGLYRGGGKVICRGGQINQPRQLHDRIRAIAKVECCGCIMQAFLQGNCPPQIRANRHSHSPMHYRPY
jgi:hypothetical protein